MERPPAIIPRIAAPLLFGAAIVLSFQLRAAPERLEPIELASGEVPAPSAEETRAAYASALLPGAAGYDRGVTRAKVTVIEFADFGCRYCARFTTESYPRIAAEFVATGRVRWRYVPFVLGMFSNGELAARAAECAGEQGRAAFGRMHDRLYQRRDAWMNVADPAALFGSIAGEAGLEPARFASCYRGEAAGQRVRASNALAERLGVFSTPTFFINGRRVEGALPADEFRALLLEAIGGAT